MPTSLRPCSTPGCDEVTAGRRCPLHESRATRDRRQSTAGYKQAGHTTRFRPGVLDKDPICVICHQAPSTIADHYPQSRRALVAAGLDADNPRYGRGLCWSCHSKETGRRQPGGWNAR